MAKKNTKKTTSKKKTTVTSSKGKNGKRQDSSICPVVGIGASAGGLEALGLFLKNVPDDSGLAYVIVQHLDPNREAMMADLLQRDTTMPVTQVEDGVKVEANHVYMIAPDKDMSILNGTLHLFDPPEIKGLRLPIDFFFRSMAEDMKDRSRGVILSGMGSDGMMGLRAIKQQDGMTFVQNPRSAKFDGMPTSSLNDGFVDIVANVEELPGRILESLTRSRRVVQTNDEIKAWDMNTVEKILILLRAKTGHDFSQYKKNTIIRRIDRRMGVHQIDKVTMYVKYLRDNPDEVDNLFKELLIGVTNFFRDPKMWEHLKKEVIPDLVKKYPEGSILRAWTPGCSTGEEAYSLAMIFKEALAEVEPLRNYQLQIFATELDPVAIDKARAGIYSENIVTDVSEARLRRFFVQEENNWKICPEIRESVIFATQNVAMDPPFTKLDLVVCRNLLIYLEPELQQKIISLFHYSLKPGGLLILGSAETVGSDTILFSPFVPKLRIYKRIDDVPEATMTDFPTTFRHIQSTVIEPPMVPDKTQDIETLTERILLRQHTPAAVLTSNTGDILYVSGRTGKYLEPAEGKANWNILAMAREGLRMSLQGPFTEAASRTRPTVVEGVTVGTNGGTQEVDIAIQPLSEPLALKNTILLTFKDRPPSKDKKKGRKTPAPHSTELKQVQLELQQAREHVQIINEEMQTSQEELKSSNEELQSTNEELQSTNEELTTSKEEMQSMNEELQTVNQELKVKIDDLSIANNDMKNLLDSTNIATLFLDANLKVRRFTTMATKIFKLIPTDVGRSFTDIVSELNYPGIREDVEDVLRSLIYIEKQIPATENRWYLVRIMPYRTLDNRIDGLVITFTDISESKRLELTLRDKEEEALGLLSNMPQAYAVVEPIFNKNGAFVDGRYLFVNSAFEDMTDMKLKDVKGNNLSQWWPDAEASWAEPAKSVIQSGKPCHFSVSIENTGKTVKGQGYLPGQTPDKICLLFES